ncbi:hypothetical protein Q8F55_003825 [Vanrija albida]|uniref:C2H2-type domain-containing protein n=1 Tax=Vanrija albida TaxID=181172 RepID=A0ABR3Q522_9TREE
MVLGKSWASHGLPSSVSECSTCGVWLVGYEEIDGHRAEHVKNAVTAMPRSLVGQAGKANGGASNFYCPINVDLPRPERGATFNQRQGQLFHINQHLISMAKGSKKDAHCPFGTCSESPRMKPAKLADHFIVTHGMPLAGLTKPGKPASPAGHGLIDDDMKALVVEKPRKKRAMTSNSSQSTRDSSGEDSDRASDEPTHTNEFAGLPPCRA